MISHRTTFVVIVLTVAACPLLTVEAAEPSSEELRFFEQKVRPLLVEHCFSCHGGKKQEGGLRLDSHAFVLKGSDTGKIVESGDPEGSRLIEAVRYKNADLQMPPDGQLRPKEIAAFEKWVQLGLPWPKTDALSTSPTQIDIEQARASHWAFQPVVKPTLPEVGDAAGFNSPIDRFITARLEANGLSLSARADRRTLIRRATFDLIGLPPTPAEVADFVEDDSPDAYERLIDRLLASPHYGEHWGRHWLDVARYADNKGYVLFEEKNYPWSYTYRDYVIRAFNEDIPYDRFVVEQLAADQLDLGTDKSALAAMGFLTLGPRFVNNLHDILDDRIDVVTRGLMGLTVTCARCHDHKFDPIPQADYYSLYGVFRSSEEPLVPPLFEPPPESEQYKKFAAEMKKRLDAFNKFVHEKHSELVESAKTRAAEYLLAADEARKQPSVENFMLLTDAGALNPAMIMRWTLYLKEAKQTEDSVWDVWFRFSELPVDEFSDKSATVTAQLKTESEQNRSLNRLVREEFSDKPPATMSEVAERYSALLNRVRQKWTMRVSESESPIPAGFEDPAEEALRLVFYGENAPPNVPMVFGWGFLDLLPDRPAQGVYKKLVKEIETWSTSGEGAPPRAMILQDSKRLFEPYVFLRGNPNRHGPSIPRQHLQLLSSSGKRAFTHGSGRLDLARGIIAPENPLTARVLVNRVWHHHFGSGLVKTLSDFGLRSDPPSHPLLLDWLAATFVKQGWSLKRLHRQIMLSSTYQQRSDDRPDCQRVDPENRLLWKMNRRRLGFEATRDAMIAVTGQLNTSLGGPPEQILKNSFLPRRTLYGFIDRLDLPGLYRAFDFPSPIATSTGREQTTIPPQSLFLMNNPFSEQCARRVASRSELQAETELSVRLKRLFQTLYSRTPTAEEVELARGFLESENTDGKLWIQFVHALLMSNEFITVD